MINNSLVRNILKFSNSEIILLDSKLKILSNSSKILALEYTSKNFLELIKNNASLDTYSSLEAYFNKGDIELEFPLILENRYFKGTISKIEEKISTAKYVVVLNDYTTEEKIRLEKKSFVEILEHDLKTPIRAEDRALKAILKGTFGTIDGELLDIIQELHNSCKFMTRMTDNILTKMLFDINEYTPRQRYCSLKETLDSCIKYVEGLVTEAHQKVFVSIEANIDKFIFDQEALKLCLINVLTNASEYSPKNSSIYINILKDDNNIVISIKDEGIGISADKIDKIFEIHSPLEQKFKKVSSGIGLYVVKNLIEAQNGSIVLNKAYTQGCEFILTLPIKLHA